MEIQRHIAQGFGKGELYDVLTGLDNQSQVLPYSGRTYYVSAYGNNTTGLSWETAFKTIAAAITASNTYIALSNVVGGRNRIYIDSNAGANWEEALTVYPNQCDMVGIGSKGGWPVTIHGRQNIDTAVTGCHIYNLRFYNPTTSVPVMIIPDGSHGFEIHNCIIRNGDGMASTIGIQIGSFLDFKINGCKIIGNPPCVTGITITGVACAYGEITNNFISATTTGIEVAANTTADYGLIIKGNVIARLDPNTVAQMTYGIRYLDTQSRIHCFMCDNFISAVTYISHASSGAATALANSMVGNRYVSAGDHYIDGHAIS